MTNTVRDVRLALGLSVLEMAVRLGASVASVYTWEAKGTTPQHWETKARLDRLAAEAKRKRARQ